MTSKVFFNKLQKVNPEYRPERWVYVPYDQLNEKIGPLHEFRDARLGIILIESSWKPQRRRYHKQKLVHLLSNQRHFALEQAERGIHVKYIIGQESYGTILKKFTTEHGLVHMAEAAERELRNDLAALEAQELIIVHPHTGWLTTAKEFQKAADKNGKWRMDKFYRLVRKRTGILMDDDGKPTGGQYSFDELNRKPWREEYKVPNIPKFKPTDVTLEVCDLVEKHYAEHPGTIQAERIAATKEHAQKVWRHAKRECMTLFGDFEDAMTTKHRRLFHTGLSELMNIHRLLPHDVVHAAVKLDIPLNSKEGFIRQIIGWREFVYHVHRATDGFRLTGLGQRIEYPRGQFLPARYTLPPVFWGTESGLKCLDQAVSEVMEDGYTHHINRLMILSNWATLLGINPLEVSEWFWSCFTDAYEWVVEPNVLGMGTFGAGDLMTTKPYVSGSGYVSKMSDYCKSCHFNPKKDCPMTPLYWSFLHRNKEKLATNPRLKLVMASENKRSDEKKSEDLKTFRHVTEILQRGERLAP